MSEAFLIRALADCAALVGVGVYGSIPETRPERFVTVERTGGQVSGLVDYPTFAVQCWGESRAEAAALASRATQALQSLVSYPQVASISVDSLYNFPDPDSRQARYQLTVSAVIML